MRTIKAENRATILESGCRCAIADKYTLEAMTVLFRSTFKYDDAAWIVAFEILTIFRHFFIRFLVGTIYRFKAFFFGTIGLDVANLNAEITTNVFLNVFRTVRWLITEFGLDLSSDKRG